jgi:hypothetical protein
MLEGAAMMQDISVLTPPLLMCAAVLLAIGLFLRHEMGRKAPEDEDRPEDIPAVPPISGQDAVGNNPLSANSSVDDDEG